MNRIIINLKDMKKIVVALMTMVMVLAGFRASAQGKWGADSANCIKYLSFYDESYKSKKHTPNRKGKKDDSAVETSDVTHDFRDKESVLYNLYDNKYK